MEIGISINTDFDLHSFFIEENKNRNYHYTLQILRITGSKLDIFNIEINIRTSYELLLPSKVSFIR